MCSQSLGEGSTLNSGAYLTYTFTGPAGTCQTYTFVQGCYYNNYCYGTVEIFVTGTLSDSSRFCSVLFCSLLLALFFRHQTTSFRFIISFCLSVATTDGLLSFLRSLQRSPTPVRASAAWWSAATRCAVCVRRAQPLPPAISSVPLVWRARSPSPAHRAARTLLLPVQQVRSREPALPARCFRRLVCLLLVCRPRC